LSRADFFALVYLRAIAQGIKNGNNTIPYVLKKIPYFYGKRDNGMIYNNDT
jgi:hypothetical protein